MIGRFIAPLLLLLLIGCTLAADPLNPYDDPRIGAALEHYDIDVTVNAVSRLTCADGGARCVFRRENFAYYSFGRGQETEVAGEGATWAATVDGAVLTLHECTADQQGGNCVVSCNANCTCAVTLPENSVPEPCVEVATRAPTPAPKDEPPAFDQCPKRQFTQYCPELMNTGLPEGLDDEFECYNFCGGSFISVCDLEGNCGEEDCADKTATGTMNGQVFGCTLQDKLSFSPGNSGASVRTRNIMTVVLAIAAAVATFW